MLLFFMLLIRQMLALPVSLDAYLSSNTTTPLLLEITSPWCPYCRRFQPSWENISHSEEFRDKILFAQLSCELHPFLCNRFPGSSTPRFYWLNGSSSEPKQFLLDHSIENLKEFIDSNLNGKLLSFSGMDKVIKLHYSKPLLPLFVFNVSDSELDFVYSLTRQLSALPAIFTRIPNPAETRKLFVIDKRSGHSSFGGNWTKESINDFINMHLVPFFSHFSPLIEQQLDVLHLKSLIFVHQGLDQEESRNLLYAGESVRSKIIVTQTTCKMSRTLCRYVGLQGTKSTSCVVYDKSKDLFWVNTNISDRFSVKPWLEDVLAGRIPPKGRGNNFFAMIYYDMRARGGFLQLIPVVLVIVLVNTFLFVICSRKSETKVKTD